MSDFRTILNPAVSDSKIGLKDSVLTIGSCFSNAIGDLLAGYKVGTCVNPFGTLYNPPAIHKALQYAIRNEAVSPATFTQHQEVYLNYDFHSELSDTSRESLAMTLKSIIDATGNFLRSANWLIITYGTAWVYQRNDTGDIVANCHKQPASLFTKSLLTPEEVVESFEKLYNQVKLINPSVNIILTVSPVRHIKDTLALNSVSKSVLRLASHLLSGRHADVHYFPAYEIMMDDLRDYRFYEADKIHPTRQAEEYIWKRFIESFANIEFKNFMPSWDEILTAIAHKPFHPNTEAHQRFLRQTLSKLQNLQSLVNIDFEKKLIENRLTKS